MIAQRLRFSPNTLHLVTPSNGTSNAYTSKHSSMNYRYKMIREGEGSSKNAKSSPGPAPPCRRAKTRDIEEELAYYKNKQQSRTRRVMYLVLYTSTYGYQVGVFICTQSVATCTRQLSCHGRYISSLRRFVSGFPYLRSAATLLQTSILAFDPFL